MNKSELIESIADKAAFTKTNVSQFLNAFCDVVTDVLQKGEQIVIPGFGTFSVSERSARTGRNPQTGEPLDIAAASIPKFKAGKSLKDAVNVK